MGPHCRQGPLDRAARQSAGIAMQRLMLRPIIETHAIGMIDEARRWCVFGQDTGMACRHDMAVGEMRSRKPHE